MSAIQKKILATRIKELGTRWERLTEKLNLVTRQRDNETRAEEKMRMDAIIKEIEAERLQIAADREKLENELNSLDRSDPTPSSTIPPAPDVNSPKSPVTLFYSYSHKDEALRDKLNTHLKLLERHGLISSWHDRAIGAGREWEKVISEQLEAAEIILLLISADFLASDYIYDVELKRTMERHENGEARVIPVILRACDWHPAPFGKLQALPKDAQPVTSWPNQDEAYTNIARGIRAVAKELNAKIRKDS